MFHYKRKTRSSGIFQHPQLLRVLALMRLNRRVPVGTHGGVRGRPSDFEGLLLDLKGVAALFRRGGWGRFAAGRNFWQPQGQSFS